MYVTYAPELLLIHDIFNIILYVHMHAFKSHVCMMHSSLYMMNLASINHDDDSEYHVKHDCRHCRCNNVIDRSDNLD